MKMGLKIIQVDIKKSLMERRSCRVVSQNFIFERLNPLIALKVVLGHTKRV